jgi:hypothetical protein
MSAYTIVRNSTQQVILEKLKEIPSQPYNPKIHYHVHKIAPLDHLLNQVNPVYILTHYFC